MPVSKIIKRLIAGAVLVAAFIVIVMVVSSLYFDEVRGPRPQVNSADFRRVAGFSLPPNANILYYRNLLGSGIGGDGLYSVVFEVDSQEMAALTSQSPWHGHEWEKGPLPDAPLGGLFDVPSNTSQGMELPRNKAEIYFIIDAQGPVVAERHESEYDRGRLLVVDPVLNRVWFSWWSI